VEFLSNFLANCSPGVWLRITVKDRPTVVRGREGATHKPFTEVEFLEEIQTEVLRVFLLAIHRHLY
jgi:hypothetical protein